MADNFLPEEAIWEEGIRQIETTDTVLGGPGGIPNIAPNQLANRTLYLREKLFNKGQFLAYNPSRVYQCGDVCYTVTAGKVSYWEWYSNVESFAGKDPLDTSNRQSGWVDDTKPFYWTPYKKARSGTPLWPWMSMTFPEGTLNVLGNSVPTAVFWRLAEAFPEFINGDNIDFPETGGEFFRVLDQGRGVDPGRALGEFKADEIKAHAHTLPFSPAVLAGGTTYNDIGGAGAGMSNVWTANQGGSETRPRSLAFPILVEV